MPEFFRKYPAAKKDRTYSKRNTKHLVLYLLFLGSFSMVILALFLNTGMQVVQNKTFKVEFDKTRPAISIELLESDIEYMCLTSAEYSQLHLPDGYECWDCSISSSSREVLEKPWSEDSIIIAYKSGPNLSIHEIRLPEFDGYRLKTWYRSVSYRPETYRNMSQCTRRTVRDIATCNHKAFGECLFLFYELIPIE